jgi:F-type H+-transporting ATPase subunit b
MVTLNFTIVVQLALFGLFVWVANRLVLRPTLRVMDRRAETMEEDRVAAESDAAEAQALESRYTAEIAAARRASNVNVERARRDALDARNAALNERHRESDKAIADVEAAATAEIEAQRGQFKDLTRQIAEGISRHLNLGGPES